jgi:chloramphenicol-sensitive protein RarD
MNRESPRINGQSEPSLESHRPLPPRSNLLSASTHPGADPTSDPRRARIGALSAIACYIIWGLVPLYWKRLAHVDSLELIAHRQVWSLLFLLVLLLGTDVGWRPMGQAMGNARSMARLALGAALLTVNWLVYVWGVNSGNIIETSLGYFLVPLFSVLAGRFLLREQLRSTQWIAIAVAAVGVALMVARASRFPWIALALAGSWGCYGVLRKTSSLGALPALASETLLLAPFALGFLAWRHHAGTGALGRADLATHLLIISSGFITAIPLLLFAHAATRIRLSTLGILQYIAPTGQFLLGLLLYHEPVSSTRLISFLLIWIALAIYTADNFLSSRTHSVR